MSRTAAFATAPGRWAWWVLAVGLALSLGAFAWLQAQARHALEMRLQAHSREARDAIEARLRAYADVLHGLSAFFHGSDTVSRADFRRYAARLELQHRYPGLQLLSYVEQVPHARRAAFEQAMREEARAGAGDAADFRIHPDVRRELYYVVKYVEPLEDLEANLGFDLAGDWGRRATVERARDSGRLAASARLQPVRSSNVAASTAYQLRLPIYRVGLPLATEAQRREAFTGVVGAGLNLKAFMANTLTPGMRRDLHLAVYDTGPSDGAELPMQAETLLYDSADDGGATVQARGLRAVHLMDLGGRRWTVVMRPTPAFM